MTERSQAKSFGQRERQPWPVGIWAAAPTPFCDDHTLDLAGIRHNVARFQQLGLEGIFCNGLMGEGWSLSLGDRRSITSIICEAAGDGLKVGVVTTHGSTAETIELSRQAAACGVDHIVLMRPAGLFAPAELADLVRMVADVSACRVVLFDSEAQSGGYPVAVIRALAREGRIHAVKSTRNGDAVATLRSECGDVVSICDPYESRALGNLVRFNHRTLYADPEPYLYQLPGRQPIRDYFACHVRGDLTAMLKGHVALEPLRRVYQRWIEVPLMRGQPINAALKHWCRRMGLATGPVRRPLLKLDADAGAALDADLDQAFTDVFGAVPEDLY